MPRKRSLHLRVICFCSLTCLLLSSCASGVLLKAKKENALMMGYKLYAPTPQPEKYFNDLMHPCVRYIEEGFAGYQWWMTASPYMASDNKMENPILFYGIPRSNNLPPLEWVPVAIVEDTHKSGYNSDPLLYFEDGRLWVLWREVETPDLKGISASGTFGRYTTDGKTFSEKKLFLPNTRSPKRLMEDNEMCPIILDVDGVPVLYAVDHDYIPPMRSNGLSISKLVNGNSLLDGNFQYETTVDPLVSAGNMSKKLRLWHFDMFSYEGVYYCTATTFMTKEVYLGRSYDGVNFSFWAMPLISRKISRAGYIYKTSAMVKDGVFYLWHSANEDNGKYYRTTRIWMDEIPWDELMETLEKYPMN